jgi:hypothetical protein
VVGVQDEDRSMARERTGSTLYSSHGTAKHMLQEVRRVVEIVARIDERLADRILVGHRAIVGIFAIMRCEARSSAARGSLMSVLS